MGKKNWFIVLMAFATLSCTAQTFSRKLSKNDSLSNDGKKLITWDIAFYFVSDSLVGEGSFTYIDQLAGYLKANPDLIIEVGAHSITRGAPEFWNDLTKKRAVKICALLVEKGIAKSRLLPRGYGKSKPFYTAPPSTMKCADCDDKKLKKNLRVEFQIVANKKR